MKLDPQWEKFLSQYFNVYSFYKSLKEFVSSFDGIIPEAEKIFAVFTYMKPDDVKCVLLGEDPYPRLTSACGVAFWDKEIISWQDRTEGNSLKNILKGLLTFKRLATYNTSIAECRNLILKNDFPSPDQLFKNWLSEGVLLINTSLTFSSNIEKKKHFEFWKPFQLALITALNSRVESPFYILWGKKAQGWEKEILKTIDDKGKIIKQGHPTFIHQFMKKTDPFYSPFDELTQKTNVNWF